MTSATKVLILHNEPTLPAGHPDRESEVEVMDTVRVVSRHLTDTGLAPQALGIGRDPEPLIAVLRARRPDVIFNLFEGIPEQGHSEGWMAGLLEWLRVPFTGCPSSALQIARNKPLAKYLFQ